MRHTIALLIALAFTTPTLAQDRLARWFAPHLGDAEPTIRYESTAYFNEDVGGQNTKLHLVRHELRGSVPIYQEALNEFILHGSVKGLDLDTGARLPGTFDELPATLWDVRLGLLYRHKFENGWIGGGDLTLGSASDHPFSSLDEVIVRATGFVRIPHGDDNAWLLYVNYASEREFCSHVPLPGFGYQINAGRQFNAIVGLPLTTLRWEPIERLSLEGTYFIPRTVRSRIRYQILEPLSVYAGFDWTNERFYRTDRRDSDDRLFHYEKRVLGGVRWDISDQCWLDFAAGFAFDRMWFEGDGYDDRAESRLDIDDGPLLRIQFGLRM